MTSTRNRVRWTVIGSLAIGALFIWWLERDRARHVDRPADTESHIAAARMALREIRTAQELHAAEHDGRYSGSIDTLVAVDGELAAWLDATRGVTARVDAGVAGEWYAAEVGHRGVPGLRCRVASDSAPEALAGALSPWVEACDSGDALPRGR